MTASKRSISLAVVALAITGSIAMLTAQGRAPAGERGRGEPDAPPAAQPGHPSGKLVIWGDLAIFIMPGNPDNCVQTNRFKKGQRIGFRMTAIDGGTGEPENTATLTAHLVVAGRTIDVPMRWRGAAGPTAPPPRGYLTSPYNLWVGYWLVPDDAPTGTVKYTVTATDRFGRTATFTPFSYENGQLAIVQ